MTPTTILTTLETLYILHASNLPVDAGILARRLGVRPTAVAEAFLHLESKGLLDASTARLTMPGLAAAAALHAHRRTHRAAA